MLHIVLTILKIIGILLLVLLGLVLFLLLSLLFVPVCYSGWGKRMEEGRLWGKASVSWLFHLIHCRVIYEEEKAFFEVWLLGIPLLRTKQKIDGWKSKRTKKAGKKKPKPERKTSEKEPETEPEIKSGIQPETEPEIKSGIQPETEPEIKSGIQPETEPEIKSEIQPERETKPSLLSRFFERCGNIIRGILQIPAKILEGLRKIRLTFRGFCDKIKQWREFIKEETTRETISFLWAKGKGVLRHLLPRKIRGHIRFGFEDPALTGQILGGAAMFYPVYGKNLQIIPVFDREILEWEIRFSGRIFGCYFLWTAWQIFRKKEVRATWQRFKNKEA